ncbi:MAG: ferritin-like domain-containing protein [Deltaproteobacteria bacterium]|nr:ferritin-like domain-containing protein [Deltaproteobacteria bacterium]
MPLQNFGSILNFAEELEQLDQRFYEVALTNPACGAHAQLFTDLAVEAGKNVKTVQRLRRENVTEMILEPVRDFTRASFCEGCAEAAVLTSAEVLKAALRLEARAERYYLEAAGKIQALTEVSRALRTLGKIRKTRAAKISAAGR